MLFLVSLSRGDLIFEPQLKITPQKKNATDLIKDERLECQIGKKKQTLPI